MIANRLEKNKTKTKRQIVREAGYTESTAIQSTRIINSEAVQAELQRRTAETIQRMEYNRGLMIQAIPGKVKRAPFNHLVNGVDIFTKNIQLLSGKSTENKAIHIEISEHVANKNGV